MHTKKSLSMKQTSIFVIFINYIPYQEFNDDTYIWQDFILVNSWTKVVLELKSL